MGPMTSPASESLKEIVVRLDRRIQTVDEERWLSSRYARAPDRDTLIVLYAFYYELARVRVAVTDQTLGSIRFQWWRDALDELARGEMRQHDVVIALGDQIERDRLHIEDLRAMIEQHEEAFLSENRTDEPDDLLAVAGLKVLGEAEFDTVAMGKYAKAWASLRRGEEVALPKERLSLPASSRPAIAHFRLAHAWAKGRSPSAFQRRLSILFAISVGRI